MDRKALENFANSVLKIRPGEFDRVAVMFLYCFSVVSAFITGRTIRDTLFLSHYDVSLLPWMYVAVGLVTAVTMWLYGRVEGRWRRDHTLIATTIALFLLTYASHFAVEMGDWFYPAFYIFVDVCGTFLIIQFWTYANEIFVSREAKRLFSVIGAGGTLANVIGFGISALVGMVGVENLILFFALALVVSYICIRVTSQLARQQLDEGYRARIQKAKPAAGVPAGDPPKVRVFGSKHLQIIAAIVCATFVVTTFVDYQFKMIARSEMQGEELASFFGMFFGITGILAFIIQFLVTNRLLERFGVLIAMLLLPAFLCLGTASVLLYPILLTAALNKGFENVFRYTINDATMQLLYVPVPATERGRAKARIDGVLKPLSIVIAGLALLALSKKFGLKAADLSWPALVLLGVWLVSVFRIKGEYVKSLLDTLQRRRLNFASSGFAITDDKTVKLVRELLHNGKAAEALHALELLPFVKSTAMSDDAILLLQRTEPEVREHALMYLAGFASASHAELIRARFTDPEPAVRAAAVTAYCAICREAAIPVVRECLKDESPRMKAAVVAGLIKHGGLDGILTAAEDLKKMLASPEPSMREQAAWVLGEINVRSFYHPLLALLQDTRHEVQVAAVTSAGRLKSPELIPALIYKLGERRRAGAATSALAAYGPGIEPVLGKVLANHSEDPAIRRNVPKVLARVGTQAALDQLLACFHDPDVELRGQVIRAANRMLESLEKPKYEKERVRTQLDAEIHGYYHGLRLLADLGLDGKSTLLSDTLQEKQRSTLTRIFHLLGLIYPSKTVEIVHRNMRSPVKVARANAIEVMDNLLDNETKKLLLPLLEDTTPQERLREATEELAGPKFSRSERIRQLLDHDNAWVIVCALHLIGEERAQEFNDAVRLKLTARDLIVRESAVWVLHRTADAAGFRAALDEHLEQIRANASRYLLGVLNEADPPALLRAVGDKLAIEAPVQVQPESPRGRT